MTEPANPIGDGRQRWFAVGRSHEDGAEAAGAAAARSALAGGEEPKLLIVFASPAFDQEQLLAAIGAVAPDVPLVGCSTAGEIAGDGPGDGGVVVAALGGPGFTVATAATEASGRDLRAAGEEVAACAESLESSPHRVLLLFADPLSGNHHDLVRGAYSVVGASMPLVGGCAAPARGGEITYQLHGGSVLSGAVVAAAIGSDAPIGIGLRHGWTRTGEPLVVTRSDERNVHTLNDRPALEVYLEAFDAPVSVRNDPAAFAEFAMTRPLGMPRRHGEEDAHCVNGADFEESSLHLLNEFPQGALAWLMEGDRDTVLDATAEACAEALAPLGETKPLGLLAFDCNARRGVLGDEGIEAEIARLTDAAPDVPVAGFYTWGEIARTRGQSGFHNQTLVVMALA